MSFQHQFGTAEEVTWGTAVTVDRFHEFLPGESLQRNQSGITPSGLRPGVRVRKGAGRVQTRDDATGNVQFEVMNQGFGRLFEHMLGSVASSQPDIPNSPTVYDHTFTPGDLSGMSLTLQKGVEKTDGTVQAFTYPGSKVMSWVFAITDDAILTLDVGFDAKKEDDTIALATASYPSNLLPFHFAQGSLSIDASTVATVSNATFGGSNPSNVQRYYLGQSGNKSEQRINDYVSYSGQMTAEFEDLTTLYDLFTEDTSAVLELVFTGPVISDDEAWTLTLTGHDVRFTGETPKITGPDVPTITAPWEGFEDSSGESVEIVYRTTGATP